jgi:hypothetical protein
MCVCVCVCWYVNICLLFVCYNLYSVGSPAVAVVKRQLFMLLQDMQLSQEGLQSIFSLPGPSTADHL